MRNKDMVEELSTCYASVFTVEDTSSMPELQEPSVAAITGEMTLGKLKGLKVDKSPRPDGLQPRVLKETAKEIVEAFVQELLESGRVQEDWKIAN
eukprot:g31387.t1